MIDVHPIRGAALAATLLAGACLSAAADVTCDAEGICKDEPLLATDAEIAWRYVGRLPLEFADAPCPPAPGWSGGKLDAGPGPLPLPLRRFCVYTANNPANPMPPVPGPPGLEQIDPDIMAVAAMGPGGPLKNTLGPDLQAHFLEQAGQAGVAAGGSPNVRLAILDTMPDDPTPLDEPVPTAGHGHALLHMVEELACNGDQANCAIRLSTNLALPWECTAGPVCRDTTNGGYLGTPVDLAEAVARELSRWQVGNETGLVINLSLGWDRLFNETALGDVRVATEAAQRAIETAVCRGALVIAATGNAIAGPVRPDGPLMPAEWNRAAALTRAQCIALLPGEPLPPADFPPIGTDRPLVHAVGAIGADGGRFLARQDAEPELVAFGDHAVASDGSAQFTDTLSGSSVASAVVSAAAAAVWSFDDTRAGWEVMQAVYDAGTSVPTPDGQGLRSADFCVNSPGACGEVHRVTLCQAVEASCTGPGCPTPQDLACAVPQYREALIDRGALAAAFTGAPGVDFAQPGYVSETIGACEPRPGVDYTLVYPAGQRPIEPCPHVQYFGTQATPFAGGQPGHTNCEDCPVTFASPGTLYVEVDAQFPTEDTVLFCGPADGTMVAYALEELGVLSAGQKFTVAGIDESCAEVGLTLASVPSGLPANDPATIVTPLLVNTDPDGDGVPAAIDNCLLEANADQRDTDGDGIGNRCDTDLNNDCISNPLDLGLLRAVFFTGDPDADFNGDGTVNPLDLGIFRQQFFTVPGPSADTSLCGP